MKRYLLVLFLIVGVAQADVIREIRVSGNNLVSSDEIIAKLVSLPGEQIQTDKVLADMESIYDMGVFKDNVNADTVRISKTTVDLVFQVEENPQLKQILFKGAHAFSTEELLLSTNSQPGQLLNYNNLRKDIQILTDYYHDRGYALMSVKEIIEPQKDDVLAFVIKEGVIEDIFIKGLSFTKDFVVTREMTTKVGGAFNVNTLQDDVKSIYNTGYFEDVNIDPPLAGVDGDKSVVVLNMKERRSGSLQFGGGVGSASGFFGFLKLEFINFLGEGYNVSTQGQWGEKQLTYEFKYMNPWFYPDHTSMTFRIWNTDGVIDDGSGLQAFNVGGEVSMGKPLTKQLTGLASFRANDVTPKATTLDAIPQAPYSVRSIGLGLRYDTRDLFFNPSSGEMVQANINSSLKLLGASIEFSKLRLQLNKYFPVAKDWALGFKASIDDSYGTIFDTERFYLGGSTTLRGYADGYPIGVGGRRYLANAELRYNLNASMQLYLFFDAGQISQGSATTTFEGDSSWRTGKGIGFKLSTPIGPLRFDYAWGDGGTYNDYSGTPRDSGQGVVHFNIENMF